MGDLGGNRKCKGAGVGLCLGHWRSSEEVIMAGAAGTREVGGEVRDASSGKLTEEPVGVWVLVSECWGLTGGLVCRRRTSYIFKRPPENSPD